MLLLIATVSFLLVLKGFDIYNEIVLPLFLIQIKKDIIEGFELTWAINMKQTSGQFQESNFDRKGNSIFQTKPSTKGIYVSNV